MIQYSLKCAQNHRFDSWFQSANAFDKLKSAGMVSCPVCADTKIEKAIMAPRVRPARTASVECERSDDVKQTKPLSSPASPPEQALAEFKKLVESNSDYVGDNFADEARAIHTGNAPDRAIYGEANAQDAKSLIDDGIPVAPLPFRPKRKSN
ncbi:MAG: DUF1178 family protein [Cognatishimia sp.]